MITTGLMSSNSAEHYTPPGFLALVEQVAPIGLDPCWSAKSLVRPRVAFDGRAYNGLELEWAMSVNSDEVCFVNPPYGRGIGAWLTKCVETARRGASVMALVPARTDAGWFQAAAPTTKSVCLLRGRIRFWTADFCDTCQTVGLCKKFGHVTRLLDEAAAAGPAPFPSAVLFWGAVGTFQSVFSRYGWLT